MNNKLNMVNRLNLKALYLGRGGMADNTSSQITELGLWVLEKIKGAI